MIFVSVKGVKLVTNVIRLVTNVIFSINTTHRNWKFRVVDIMAIENLISMNNMILLFNENVNFRISNSTIKLKKYKI